jgi:aspartyl-tRNA(Asn)/glutamyl-tRNA(Gln) amidotransferase subunit C
VQFEAVAGGFPALLYAPQAGASADPNSKRPPMSIDAATVRRIAHLARVAVADDEVEHLRGEINAILSFVEQLSEVDVEGVEPMTSVTPMVMKKRHDVVTDGNDADAVLRNAPATEHNYFLVPKVVE